jgi:UDP-3-O-[3-hydroxymyristoyl] glucosamine N-acyltransferase
VVTAGVVLQFLRDCGLADVRLDADDRRVDLPVKGVAADERAVAGDLSWISRRVMKSTPERITKFAGSLLICPEGADTTHAGKTMVIPSANPKLAFIRAVTKFFPDLGATRWPPLDRSALPADAVIADDVRIARGAVIGSGVSIASGASIGPGTCLANCAIGANVIIGANCTIGLPGFGYERDDSGRYWRFPHAGIVVIEDDVEIGSNTCIDRAALGETRIGKGSKIDNLVHLAHNVKLAANSVVIANSMLGGSVSVGEGAWIAPSASIMNQAAIGARAVVGLGAVVLKSVDADTTVVGNPAKPLPRKTQ